MSAAGEPSPTERRTRRMTVGWFIVLAYVFSWSFWLPLAVTGAVVVAGTGWPSHLPGLLGPALAAVVVTGVFRGTGGLRELWSRVTRWRVDFRWYVLVVGTAALAGVAWILSPGWTTEDFLRFSGAPSLTPVLLVLYVLVVNGFGEEIGWRGLLAEHLLDTRSTLSTALVVGGVWAGWHLPLFWIVGNFRDLSPAGVTGWCVGILCGSVFLTWMYRSARHSVLIVALWHTAYNFTTATTATAGTFAAVVSTAVIIAAVVIAAVPASRRSPREESTSG